MRSATRLLSAAALAAAVAAPRAAAAPITLVQTGDASIEFDAPAGTYTLRAAGAALKLLVDPSRNFEVLSLAGPSGTVWTSASRADTRVRVNGETLTFGSRSAGFTFLSADATGSDRGLQLDIVYDLASSELRFTRHYLVASGAPAFETWTTIAGSEKAQPVSDLHAVQFALTNGTLHYLTGLRGDTADVASPNPFTLQRKRLGTGESLTIGAAGRSSEQSIPWLAIDGVRDEFFVALMWSGAWSIDAARSGASINLSAGLGPMTTTVANRTIDGPHAIFGAAAGGLPQATAALRSYILNGVRAGRPFTPLVTYNTWFAYGTAIDEPSMRAEMDRAAALGVELFVVDAGWYAGAGESGPMDFDAGLGSWTPDPARFPNGLKPLTDYAHALGMKFGIWVEPERVNLSVVGENGPDESWLATHDGDYGSDRTALICLAGDVGRQWVLDHVSALIDAVQPDYLKWDNNLWVNCDRDGHGHGATDGNFAQVEGLYSVLQELRDRYPDLLIENVSGGGNRLDLGMVRYSDTAWMDDRTAPSAHVRHNVEGLSAVFPPAYLLSFVMDHDTEPLHDAPDLPLYVRSRMASALGLCFRGSDLDDADMSGLAREIAIYKSYRDALSGAAGALLTKQAETDSPPGWDVLQETSADGARFLVHAFQTDETVETFTVKPTGLDPETLYEVRSVDAGVLGTATGADLMAKGLELVASGNSAAHLLIVTAQ